MAAHIDISIISPGASLADARLHRISSALIRSGFVVEILAPGNAADAPTGAIIREVRQGIHFLWRAHRAFYSPWQAHGRVLYALAPEAQMFTWKVALLKRRIFAADVFEDYLRLLKDRHWAKRGLGSIGLLASVIARSATFFAARAAMTTVADIQVPPFKAKNRIVLRNLPDTSLLTQSGDLSKSPRALYIGDVRTSRGLRTMLDAAVLAPNWHFDIVGSVADADVAWVHLWSISNEEAASRVTFHGKLAPASAWKFAQGAWVGLTLLEPTPAFVEAVPSKLYEYMAVGLATITTSLPRCAALIQESQSGVVADSAAAVADQLQSWEKNSKPLLAMRANALAWSATNVDAAAEYEPLIKALNTVSSIHKGN